MDRHSELQHVLDERAGTLISAVAHALPALDRPRIGLAALVSREPTLVSRG